MRDPNRIDGILAALTLAWKKHPDMRLTQIVASAASLGGWTNPDPFYCEDGTMKRGLETLGSEPLSIKSSPRCRNCGGPEAAHFDGMCMCAMPDARPCGCSGFKT